MTIIGDNIETIERKILGFLSKKRIYVCGLGSIGRCFTEWLDIMGLYDRVLVDKSGKASWNEDGVITYDDLGGYDTTNSAFVITSKFFFNEIEKELINKGVDANSIIRISDDAFDLIAFHTKELKGFNKKRWITEQFRNVHKGKRIFLIGNGPSLRISDLEKLKNEITIATNDIYYVFPNTKWRPTYYVIADRCTGDKCFTTTEEFENLLSQCGTVFCEMKTIKYDKYADSDYPNLFFYKLRHISPEIYSEENEYFSDNVVEEVFGVGTTMHVMYQFAAYMGVSEVYLLGVDASYRITIDDKGKQSVNEKIEHSHADFIANKEDEDVVMVNIKMLNAAHLSAEKYAKKHGIKILNATRGGQLEIFERVDFDSLF